MKLKTYLTFWQGGHNILSKSKQSIQMGGEEGDTLGDGGGVAQIYTDCTSLTLTSLAFLFFCSSFSIN